MPYNSHKNRKRIVKPNARRAFILNDVIRLANWYARRADRNTSADDGAAKFLHDNAVEFDKIIDSIVYWSNRKPVKNRPRSWYSLTQAQKAHWENKLIRKAVKLFNNDRQTMDLDEYLHEYLHLARVRDYDIYEIREKVGKYTDYQYRHRRTRPTSKALAWSNRPRPTFIGPLQERYQRRQLQRLEPLGLAGNVVEFVPNLHPDDTEISLDQKQGAISATIASNFYKMTKLLSQNTLAANLYIDQGLVKVFYAAVLIKSRLSKQQKAQGLGVNIDWCPFSISRGYTGSFIDTKTGKRQSTSLYKTAAKALSAAREQVAASFADSLAAEIEEEGSD